MATMKSRMKWIYDAAAAVLFRAAGSAAVTATGQSAALSLDTLSAAYWDNNEIPNRELEIAVAVTASDATNNDETYVVSAEVATDSAFTTPFEVGKVTVPRGTVGGFTIVVDMDAVQNLGAMKYIRVKHTLAGTTPSLTYAAWMAQGGV